MIVVEQQIHGYRQGHQLLSSSIELDSGDQGIVDRLSDASGPLRPGETFEPYITTYPLPGGSHYVVARTWYDLESPRAGCVRTVSLLIRSREWARAGNLLPFFDLIRADEPSRRAETRFVDPCSDRSLPPIIAFPTAELVEALFLEDRKAIVVFGGEPQQEVASIRLLTAFWPTFRSRFTLSTFALSPRRLDGRSFDLVFAPSNARSRFADWDGRRIDPARGQVVRHSWTLKIVDLIFEAPAPSVLDGEGGRWLVLDESGSESALRMALLWNDLRSKLPTSPSAALGMLDIANTRKQRDGDVIVGLEPDLVRAARQAVATMSTADAWHFLNAMVRKIGDFPISASSAGAISAAARELATQAPMTVLERIAEGDQRGVAPALLPAAGDGVAAAFGSTIAAALSSLTPSALVQLLVASKDLSVAALSPNADVLDALARALTQVDPALFSAARQTLLPLLVDDQHAGAAAPLISSLDSDGLIGEANVLFSANRLSSEALFALILERADEIGAIKRLRDVVASLGSEWPMDRRVFATLRPTEDDVVWLLGNPLLDDGRRAALLSELLNSSSAAELRLIFAIPGTFDRVMALLPIAALSAHLLRHVVDANIPIPVEALAAVVLRLLPESAGDDALELAKATLERCLTVDFVAEGESVFNTLLSYIGERLDGARVARAGLSHVVSADIASRNVIEFDTAPHAARSRIVDAVEEFAKSLQERGSFDLSPLATLSCARIVSDAGLMVPSSALRAAMRLLPLLLATRDRPVSPLIAVVFPVVYRELARGADVADLLRLFFFIDWDRCKIARRDLVDAFMWSVWNPVDLALTAVRAGDAQRILKRVVRYERGAQFLAEIEQGIDSVDEPWRSEVMTALQAIRYSGG